jgi:sulfatase modifying factor 1
MARATLILVIAGGVAGCMEQSADITDGMIRFAGGPFVVGTNSGQPNEGPAFETTVAPFFLDEHPVTVAEFRKFVKATGYVTEAEKFGNSGVFSVERGQWYLQDGATWEFPLGPGGPMASENHPVTQVSWNDAREYCRWAGKRLPTEVEWECAAASGLLQKSKYSWGDQLVLNNRFMANVWQGRFPDSASVQDGFLFTSPVGYYGKTASGLTDMGGNVWEWCSDTYAPYPGNAMPDSIDPEYKVIRGGSFLCDEKVCHGYRVTARGRNSRESATFHMGFRTAKDAG